MLKLIKKISNYCCLLLAIIFGISAVISQDEVSFKLLFSLAIALGLIFLNNNHNNNFEVN
jgi:uncharacterized integral membrane protein